MESTQERINGSFYCYRCCRSMSTVGSGYTCLSCKTGFIEVLLDIEEQDLDVDFSSDGDVEDETGSHENAGSSSRYNSRFRSGRRNSEPRHHTYRISAEQRTSRFPPNSTTNGRTNGDSFRTLMGSIFLSETNRGDPFRITFEDVTMGFDNMDTILNTLIGQSDIHGPAPLSEDKINQLPNILISKEQVDAKLQCSVCWEDFFLREDVRQLPCTHVYHKLCINTWLKLHATCPVCRKLLHDEPSSSQIFGNLLRSSSSSSSSGQVQCTRCNRRGHQSAECPHFPTDRPLVRSPFGRRAVVCYACGELGHYARDCPGEVDVGVAADGLGDDEDVDDIYDFLSLDDDDPFNSTPRGSGSGAGRRCYYCKRVGHIKMNCPRITCFRCKQKGHLSYNCPNL